MKKFNPIFMWYVSAIVFYVITLYKLITEHNALDAKRAEMQRKRLKKWGRES